VQLIQANKMGFWGSERNTHLVAASHVDLSAKRSSYLKISSQICSLPNTPTQKTALNQGKQECVPETQLLRFGHDESARAAQRRVEGGFWGRGTAENMLLISCTRQ
jgi:hypothetical protein